MQLFNYQYFILLNNMKYFLNNNIIFMINYFINLNKIIFI